ncbi:hypothetical protein G9G63_26460 [Paenibacillus sp. EKM202P]|uniref:hypothetical protein n=1 Tax=Paenibacillus TaxID=44249 RepID=UPI0013EB2CDA|nr:MULTISPECIES: hypothetical protein [unclassified Paenibacillus]KAF6556521.1 hypothetical protein G9G63_26460 [Paenibacillus sp. EKM202P]KAF6562909.1 hypothetical protein G9G64_26415 [Paenibacillus sp. EKM207P]
MNKQALKGFALICIVALLIHKWLFLTLLFGSIVFYVIGKIDFYQMKDAYKSKKKR